MDSLVVRKLIFSSLLRSTLCTFLRCCHVMTSLVSNLWLHISNSGLDRSKQRTLQIVQGAFLGLVGKLFHILRENVKNYIKNRFLIMAQLGAYKCKRILPSPVTAVHL